MEIDFALVLVTLSTIPREPCRKVKVFDEVMHVVGQSGSSHDVVRICLRSSLDFQYELAGNLFSLYCYADRELARDMFSLKVDNLDTIEMIFTKLRDAYQQISSQDQSGPLMENIQSVYAGLTYGRTDLNESLVNYDAKRGFLV